MAEPLTAQLPDGFHSALAYLGEAFVDVFTSPSSRYFWAFLASSLLLSAVSYARVYRWKDGRNPLAFVRFSLPSQVYTHPSAVLDYKIWALNQLLFVTPFSVGLLSLAGAAALAHALLELGFGPAPRESVSTWAGTFGVSVAVAMAVDFAAYVFHAAHHFRPALWPLHRLHHTAEVLTPFTLSRMHPLYRFVSEIFNSVFGGCIVGAIFYAFGSPPELLTLMGGHAVYTLFHLAGAHLRHSHVWLSWGPWLEHVIISPAQHQIHHSDAPRHRDKNLGEVFALWDWVFGTLYVPRGREELRFGVRSGESLRHETLSAALLEPLASSGRVLGRALRRGLRRRRSGLASN